jgi:hypothetical protein
MPPSKERIDVLNPATDDWIVCVIDYDRLNHVVTVTDARDASVSSSFALVRTRLLFVAVVFVALPHFDLFSNQAWHCAGPAGRCVRRATRTQVRHREGGLSIYFIYLFIQKHIFTFLVIVASAVHCRCAAATLFKCVPTDCFSSVLFIYLFSVCQMDRHLLCRRRSTRRLHSRPKEICVAAGLDRQEREA